MTRSAVSSLTSPRVSAFSARETVPGWTRAARATSRRVAGPVGGELRARERDAVEVVALEAAQGVVGLEDHLQGAARKVVVLLRGEVGHGRSSLRIASAALSGADSTGRVASRATNP